MEESGLPRLYRDAPLNSIWEGSGNVQALDAVRALRREPAALDAVLAEVEPAAAEEPRLAAALGELRAALPDGVQRPELARRLAERMALVLQGALLVRHAPAAVADAFCATRLAGDGGYAFGTLPPGAGTAALVERAAPPPGGPVSGARPAR